MWQVFFCYTTGMPEEKRLSRLSIIQWHCDNLIPFLFQITFAVEVGYAVIVIFGSVTSKNMSLWRLDGWSVGLSVKISKRGGSCTSMLLSEQLFNLTFITGAASVVGNWECAPLHPSAPPKKLFAPHLHLMYPWIFFSSFPLYVASWIG